MANVKTLFVRASVIPVATRGAEGTTSVVIGENGQFRFSSKVSVVARKHKYAAINAVDANGKTLVDDATFASLSKAEQKEHVTSKHSVGPLKVSIHLLDTLPEGFTIQDMPEMKWSDKTKNTQVYFTGLRFCTFLGYDYKASGSQTFDATIEDNIVHITVPKGAMTPHEKRPRAKKVKNTEGQEIVVPESANAAAVGVTSDLSLPE